MNKLPEKVRVTMLGTDESTGGGMWTVVKNYIDNERYNQSVSLRYIPTFVVGSKVKRFLFAAHAFIKIGWNLITFKPQILHVHMAEKGSVYRKGIAMHWAKKRGCRIVLHMHGAEFQLWYESLTEEKRKRVQRIINRADRMIILGDYWKSFMSGLYPQEMIHVVYNAVHQQNNIYNPNGSVVLFLGAVGKRKGAYDLVKAFENVVDRIPSNIHLCFYGPDFEHQIGSVIANSKVSDRVKYCGWLDKSCRESVFSDVICNVLPSYNEGLPMTILETMSFGIPNISSTIAAIPEVITDQIDGLLVNPGDIQGISDALVTICNDLRKRKTLSVGAYKRISEVFSINKHIDEILKIYHSVLNERKMRIVK